MTESAEEKLVQLVDTLEDLADLSAYDIAADADAWKKQAMTLIRAHTDLSKLEARLEEARLSHGQKHSSYGCGFDLHCWHRERIADLERQLAAAKERK